MTSRFSLHYCCCAAETTSSLKSPQNLHKVNHIVRANHILRCSLFNQVLLKNYSLWCVLEWWSSSMYWRPRFFLRQPTAPLLCIAPTSNPCVNLFAVGFSGSCPQHPLHCSVPASTSHSLGSTPQSIHVCVSYFRLVVCHVANASQNVIYKAQCTLASSQFCSAGMRPSCHSAHSEMNRSGCRHRLVAVGQESALPSCAEGSAWQLAHQLLKDALEVLPLSSVVCTIEMPHLPAKELSQLYAWCGGARPFACLLGVSTRNDERRSARSQRAAFTSAG